MNPFSVNCKIKIPSPYLIFNMTARDSADIPSSKLGAQPIGMIWSSGGSINFVWEIVTWRLHDGRYLQLFICCDFIGGATTKIAINRLWWQNPGRALSSVRRCLASTALYTWGERHDEIERINIKLTQNETNCDKFARLMQAFKWWWNLFPRHPLNWYFINQRFS